MRGALRGLLVLIDFISVLVAFVVGYWARLRFPLFAAPTDPPPFESYTSLMVIHATTLILLFFLNRLYHQRRAVSRIDQFYSLVTSVSVGVIMTSGLSTILLKNTGAGVTDYPRQMILYVWLFSLIFVMLGRELHRLIMVWLRVTGTARDRVLIVGSGEVAQSIVQQIQFNPQLGYVIVGAVNGKQHQTVAGVPIIGQPDDLPRLIDEMKVDEVIIALPDANRNELMYITGLCQRGRVSVKIFPDLFAYMTGGMSVDELGGIPLISVRDVALRGWKLTVKRGVDVVGSAIGLVLLSPMMLLVAILIKLESRGPVFFSQDRAGLDGRSFPMIKFRTMRRDAEQAGPGWTVQGDPRVTRLGRFLRSTNMDELPNLINVLFGQMSLVGPRPEQTHFVTQFREKIPRYMERHREKAGMTGWAQVNGLRGNTSIEERIKYDIWYVENWSIWLDVKILIRTVWQTVLRKSPNAY